MNEYFVILAQGWHTLSAARGRSCIVIKFLWSSTSNVILNLVHLYYCNFEHLLASF